MSDRRSAGDLFRIALIIWGIGILLAVLAGSLFLFDHYSEVNLGLVISALSAIASTSGALIALWIATSDRQDRQQERDAADFAQAKLVTVNALVKRNNPPDGIEVYVFNFGTRAIVDVTFVRLVVKGHPLTHFMQPEYGSVEPVMRPPNHVRVLGSMNGQVRGVIALAGAFLSSSIDTT